MNDFWEFIDVFLAIFFDGVLRIITNILGGVVDIFNIPTYISVYREYFGTFTIGYKILAILTVILLVSALISIVYMIVFVIRKYIRVRNTLVSQEEMLKEVGRLNSEVVKLSKEKDKILSMKVSQLGLQPGESEYIEETEEKPSLTEGESRFYKLSMVDEEMAKYQKPEFDYSLSLEEICVRFRNYAASQMGLYYEMKIIRLFVSAFASTRLLILQGISGTGKTSLPYAFGKFIENDANIAAVQPSWRDRSELFGYFNEFTKKYNETETLKKMYEASYSEEMYLTILDEMNIARIEYYFAEMLSILEMPSREEWVIDLVPSAWVNDPKLLENGRFHLPENMWYVGTANHDDSTFAISDKVYDRALPINIDSKGVYFEAPFTEPLKISYKHLEELYTVAKEQYVVSEYMLEQLDELDTYVIKHFRLAFGNRIVKQLSEFIPVYVACGATELEGSDYVIANKILRKFESLNLAFIRDEIEGLVEYLDDHFGEENMMESKEYLRRLEKMF